MTTRFSTSSKFKSSNRKRKNSRRKNKPQPIGPLRSFSLDGLTHEGKGVARDGGKVTFIAGALPGELVTAQVVKSSRHFDEAKLSQIEVESESRVHPPCAHYKECGGCSFQHLVIEQQRVAKKQWLQRQLRNVCQPDEISLLSGVAYGYRRRARLATRVMGGKLQLGFRGQGSKNVVSIDNCIVLTPRLQSIFTKLKTALLDNETLRVIADRLGHVELLEDNKGESVLFRLTSGVTPDLQEKWQLWAQQLNLSLFWQSPNDTRSVVPQNLMRYYRVDDFVLSYHPQDFIQVNAEMNTKMVAQAIEWLDPNEDDVILDLFCGVGNFSLPLAKRAKQVVGVEVQASMVAAGKRNAKSNQLDNLSFIAADLTQPASQDITSLGVTKVLLDPPRAGAYEFLSALVTLKPKHILYVSCDAATLARDVEYLIDHGYKVARTAMMDMFPQTGHIETMILLSR